MGGASKPKMETLWDSPMVSSVAFHPQQIPRDSAKPDCARDGVFHVSDPAEDIQIGFRLYRPPAPPTLVLVYFHANAELVTQINYELFHRLGAFVLAIGYRGYAWSTGSPKLSTLASDASECYSQAEAVLAEEGVQALPRFLFGRSLGCVPTVHLAAQHASQLSGVILESGLMDIKGLPFVQQMAMANPQMLAMLPDPIQSLRKAEGITDPVLILHGTEDEIIPYNQAEQCYRAIASKTKQLKRVVGATHNDLRFVMGDEYDRTLASFFAGGESARLTSEDVDKMSLKELREAIKSRGLDTTGCIEKPDFQALLKQNL
eukprot:c20974_g1_i1.p1 GENE.c20974_g1_i1~~c20974_g1_i1.p1  ORF type:complete len:318 (+),score=51.67 c20974_g1_i1:1-954(+)